MKLRLLAAALPLLFSMASCGGAGSTLPPIPPLRQSVAHHELLRVSGTELVDGEGRAVVLRGVAFGNQVYTGVRLPTEHHAEEDYARIAELGMNSVRFYLTYSTFEEDDQPGVYKQEGWDWLDRNVAWAKKHGIYLILNMHAPAGGYQSLGEGKALWNDEKIQERYIALWQAIAARYLNEPTVAGFDLLNEPIPTQSIEQWQELAERTISAIRLVNPHHAIFVERVNAVNGDWSENEDRNFFRVSDPNVVYEFHFYKPFHFSHQGAPWTEYAAKSARYPDPKVAEVEWFLVRSEKEVESPSLPAGDSDWKEYQTPPFLVENPKYVVGKPVLACNRNHSGTAWFDELSLEKVDEHGKVQEILWKQDLDTRRGWYFWTQDGSGQGPESEEGHGDRSSLAIEKTRAHANLGADPLRFIPEQGARYRLRGFIKGKQIPSDAACHLRLDFFSARVQVHPRTKEFLRAELDAYLDWGKREQVPLYLGEFGVIRSSFEEDRGGLRWVNDMLDLALEQDLHFAYHAYHEEYFAFFYGDGSLPDEGNANTALLELFREKLESFRDEGPRPTAPAEADEEDVKTKVLVP